MQFVIKLTASTKTVVFIPSTEMDMLFWKKIPTMGATEDIKLKISGVASDILFFFKMTFLFQ